MKPAALIADMAGTTVQDDGVVLAAFGDALDVISVTGTSERIDALAYVIETMGQSKIDVFTALFGETRAIDANRAFEAAYVERIERDGVAPIPGTEALFSVLTEEGVALGLTTGFSPRTRQALLRALGWDERISVAISPNDAGRGRPYPDMVLLAAKQLGIADLSSVVVVGDTQSDIQAGIAAGAGWVVGVESGTDTAERLIAAGATHVVATIADLTLLFAS